MKSQIIAEMTARDPQTSKAVAEKAFGQVFEAVQAVIEREGTARIPQFGAFHKKHRKSQSIRNPRTGEPMTTAARDVITFKASRAN